MVKGKIVIVMPLEIENYIRKKAYQSYGNKKGSISNYCVDIFKSLKEKE